MPKLFIETPGGNRDTKCRISQAGTSWAMRGARWTPFGNILVTKIPALYLQEMSIRLSVVRGSTATAGSRAASNVNSRPEDRRIRSTTVLCVRRNSSVVMAADGQVTLGDSVIKHSARKIRRLYQDKILAGFAGSTADAFSLFSRFEAKLEQYAGNLGRLAVELAKDWRTDKMLRNLEALLVVADLKQTFLISGSGDVIEPDEGIAAIGSGGSFALAAARA